MKFPSLKIGDKTAQYALVQGGMGIGVSGYRLAGNVAKEGGIGIISTANIGYRENDFYTNTNEANLRAIEKEIDQARKISPNGVLGINIMVAVNNYADMVKTCVRKGIDLIISGAGLPKDLPEYIKNTKTKIAPIVSSARAANLISKMWIKKYDYVPDMIVVEGPEAGGHLGYSLEELESDLKLEDIIPDVVEEAKELEKQYNKNVPVIAAGGIYDGKDIAKFLKMGASGVQMATRFVATEECDADKKFKEAYLNAKKEEIKIIKSPVGMPGRALYNKFIEKVEMGKEKITSCTRCLKPCDINQTPYCITKALINAVKGNLEEGLIFCGSNVHRLDKIVSVKELVQDLVAQTEGALV